MAELVKSRLRLYFVILFGSTIVVIIWEIFFPNVIPFGMFEFWKWDYSFFDVIKLSWPLFLFGVVLNLLVLPIVTRDRWEWKWVNPGEEFGKHMVVSILAGIFEEISFRWIIFYSQIVGYKILNIILFHFPQWWHLHVDAYIANFLTLGQLKPWIFGTINGVGWAVGAAILTSNVKFRKGHEYQGCLGATISWFIGMYMFYLVFRFGLPAAILVHMLFDVAVSITVLVYKIIKK